MAQHAHLIRKEDDRDMMVVGGRIWGEVPGKTHGHDIEVIVGLATHQS